jgi:hypothetical protein
MTGVYFTHGPWEVPINIGAPWPQRASVHLHHPIARISVPISWDVARLQVQRLDALQAAGYKKRRENITDMQFWRAAHFCVAPRCVLDHPSYFRHEGEPVILCHTYAPREEVEAQLPVICERLSRRWRCDFRYTIDPRFNIYWPDQGSDVGFEIRRPAQSRGRWEGAYTGWE